MEDTLAANINEMQTVVITDYERHNMVGMNVLKDKLQMVAFDMVYIGEKSGNDFPIYLN